ncbi:selenite/tellurite reduction operon protein ExtJ [Geomonas agri]|uniref:selenite/tellurite reduction operon protein ExtJ n=1 Tax=Geomonas agri TaxID=2873702 RepID=UPI001CD49BC1|nr:selenite/tellurite reduction operon protein ExtJ [Geomonas agri]
MLAKAMRIAAATLAVLSVAAMAFAAGPAKGKVTKVDGEQVTVTLEGAPPAFVKKGASVSAAGGSPKVVAVQGNEVTLKFGKAKAEKMKVDSPVSITECEGDELQGC